METDNFLTGSNYQKKKKKKKGRKKRNKNLERDNLIIPRVSTKTLNVLFKIFPWRGPSRPESVIGKLCIC